MSELCHCSTGFYGCMYRCPARIGFFVLAAWQTLQAEIILSTSLAAFLSGLHHWFVQRLFTGTHRLGKLTRCYTMHAMKGQENLL